MRLLWLKIYAPAEDAPGTTTRRVDARDERDSGELDAEHDLDDSGEQSSWNVKSVPRSVAPWTGSTVSAADLEPAQTGEDELVAARAGRVRAVGKAAAS